MTQRFAIHPSDPQPRLIRQALKVIEAGGVIAAPTDSCYALVARLDDKDAADRIRRIRDIEERRHLTLLCRDLSEISTYAQVDNKQYRLLKATTPGAYTFILEATREVPRRLSHPSRKTIGIRVPDHPVMLALLEEAGQGLLSSSLLLAGDEQPLNDPDEICDRLKGQLDLVIDSGACSGRGTTVVDLSGPSPVLIREGSGPLGPLGLG
ncbi:L-threonylcarbamoyladenylate synthase [Derxia gummosa]|uniref:L-threonylcarbamoyladenylate synthase n=1 Tax=Derxia gummosa DSM 723 TaxID=1121388 RepID=A0A8B6X4N0_9BURK|nr:L-threonylcarbamoyladenylate synthase [Derxia gummosa]